MCTAIDEKKHKRTRPASACACSVGRSVREWVRGAGAWSPGGTRHAKTCVLRGVGDRPTVRCGEVGSTRGSDSIFRPCLADGDVMCTPYRSAKLLYRDTSAWRIGRWAIAAGMCLCREGSHVSDPCHVVTSSLHVWIERTDSRAARLRGRHSALLPNLEYYGRVKKERKKTGVLRWTAVIP